MIPSVTASAAIAEPATSGVSVRFSDALNAASPAIVGTDTQAGASAPIGLGRYDVTIFFATPYHLS